MDYEVITAEEADAYPVAPFLNYARARATDKEERDATVGDVVHYWDAVAAACRAALVFELRDVAFDEPVTADLFVLQRSGHGDVHDVPHVEEKHHHTWHWPCGGQ